MTRAYLNTEHLKRRAEHHKKTKEAFHLAPKTTYPTSFSLAPKIPIVYDQGQLGSCTANALCGAWCLQQAIQGKPLFQPSRLFAYYQERLAEDPGHNPTDLTDSGADVMDGLSYAQAHGICSETLWPYDITRFNTPPPTACYPDASQHTISSYQYIAQNSNLLNNIKNALLAGHGVLIAIAVYANFESGQTARTGVVNMPAGAALGGHEMYIVGWNDVTRRFLVQNSWGVGWGQGGRCTIPYAYLTNRNLAFEFMIFSC